MKPFLLILVAVLCGAFPAAAQARLEPAQDPYSELHEDYEHGLRMLFFGEELPGLSVVVRPPAGKEYAVMLRADAQQSLVKFTLSAKKIAGEVSVWERLPSKRSAKKFDPQLPIDSLSIELPAEQARKLAWLFEAAIQTMQLSDGQLRRLNANGTNYLFSFDSHTGFCQPTDEKSNCGRLVGIVDQLLICLETGQKQFSEQLSQEILELTRQFKSLRRAEDLAMYKTTGLGWVDDGYTSNLLLPNLSVSVPVASSTPINQAMEVLSDYESGLRETAYRLYLLDGIPGKNFKIRIEVVKPDSQESITLQPDLNRHVLVMHLRLRIERLSPDTLMRLYHHLAAIETQDEYILDGKPLATLLNDKTNNN